MNEEYALYKGENLLSIGTISEIAREMDIKENTVKFYLYPSHMLRGKGERGKRRVLVKLDD